MKILVVCSRRYNGHELITALGIVVKAGLEFEVVSSGTRLVDEVTNKANKIRRTIDDVDPAEFSDTFKGLMIVSGNPQDTEKFWVNPKVLKLVEEADNQELPIAAICAAVPTIRYAAKGKRVSFYPLVRAAQLLTEAGAILTTLSFNVDGRIVTGEHQMATGMWATAFSDLVNGVPVRTPQLIDSKWAPKGKERRPIAAVERLKPLHLRKVSRDGKPLK